MEYNHNDYADLIGTSLLLLVSISCGTEHSNDTSNSGDGQTISKNNESTSKPPLPAPVQVDIIGTFKDMVSSDNWILFYR